MPAVKKAKSNLSHRSSAIVNNDVKSYANDPTIVKKNEEAKIAVSKLILPATDKK
jgi:hypothetical protein